MADERGSLKTTASQGYGAIGSGSGARPGPPDDLYETDGVQGWRGIKYRLRELFAETLGTFILVTFGLGGVAQTMLSERANGSWLTLALSFGLGLTFAIVVGGRISGGHFNPAVTITLAVYRQFPWLKVPLYIFAQTTGAFIAALIIFINYYPAIDNYDGGDRKVTGANATAGIFATYPQPFVGTGAAFFSESLGTFFLILVILAVTDEKNASIKSGGPFIIGLSLTTIGIALGYETGFSLNGARDFGPRLFTSLAGYGVEVFTADHWYFWVPVVAPVVGGLIAGLVYDSFIYTGKSPLNRP
jgi:aquaglyceroporin related protein